MTNYVLGLDLGARSLGWAAVAREDGRFTALLGLGVRVFEAGVEGDIERGREESRAVARRTARLARRQIRRRRQRARALWAALSRAGLLPQVEHKPGQPLCSAIQQTINALDRDLREKHAGRPAVHQLPYLLRSLCVEGPVEPYELGRALYHLGQRRGFQSNRKVSAKPDEDRSEVYSGIRDLRARLQGATLGQYLATVDPNPANPNTRKIRRQFTHRDMYRDEFERICETQSPHHPCLTPELRATLARILFAQRLLQSGDDLVGQCEWEPGEKRAPVWSLEFQRFRILQTVNHLRVILPDQSERSLTPDERASLAARLDTVRELTVAAAKRHLLLPRNARFTLEEGGQSRFKGNTVNAQMAEHFGELWAAMSFDERCRLIEDIAQAVTDEELVTVLSSRFGGAGLPLAQIAESISLPPGYASLSRKALRNVLPFLESGLSVQEARQQAGYNIEKTFEVHEFLPPLRSTPLDIRNPAVMRSLTELRKVVNAVIRKWGKPAEIHIEVARELKKSREARQEESRNNRRGEAERERMRSLISSECGIPPERVTRDAIDRARLWEECNHICPYTGAPLGSLTSLLSGQSSVHVEHIIPRSISLDDSFANLTLATSEANALKGNRTPFEAFGSDPSKFEAILQRVQNFKGPFARRKLIRFKMAETDKEALLAEFSTRHLNDTRYASRLAAQYLAHLYGSEIVEGRRVILKVTGQVTAWLRGLWNLNPILGGDARKSRDDHRHHAIDAAVIAVLGQRWINALSEASERSWREHKRNFASVEPPYIGFKEDVQKAVLAMYVSHRPDHRVSGPLHKDTCYSLVGRSPAGGDVVRFRKPVHKLSSGEVDAIADAGVRRAVLARLDKVGDIKKLEHDPPVLSNRNGLPIPIRSVRIQLNRGVQRIGRQGPPRFSEGGETHHIAIFETTQGRRRVWRGEVVPLSQAVERVRAGRPVIDQSGHDGGRFLFALCKNDTLLLEDPDGARSGLWVVKKIMASTQLLLVRHSDARPANASSGGSKWDAFSPTAGGLQNYSAKAIILSPLGELYQSLEV